MTKRIETRLLILGAGPAGISAALYARRGGAAVTVVTKGSSVLGKAEKIENYYGFAEPVSGAELLKNGIVNAKRLGVRVKETELLSIRLNDTMTGFTAETKNGIIETKAVILAAGASRTMPSIDGIKAFDGHGVSWCAICDAFFYRSKIVAVLGAGDYALHEAAVLAPHAAKVFLLTDGEPAPQNVPAEYEIYTQKVRAVIGEERVAGVQLADGTEIKTDGVFVALGTAGSTSIARTMGLMLDGNNIKVDAHMATNMPGVFAAGDCTGGLLQISKAVYQGAEAGLAAVNYLREKKP